MKSGKIGRSIMAGKCWCGLAALVLTLGLLTPHKAAAGWPFCYDQCGPSDYPKTAYNLPLVHRFFAHCRDLSVSVYPPDRYPCLPPPSYKVFRSPCPFQDPAVYYPRPGSPEVALEMTLTAWPTPGRRRDEVPTTTDKDKPQPKKSTEKDKTNRARSAGKGTGPIIQTTTRQPK
jgi:hypothetical protein